MRVKSVTVNGKEAEVITVKVKSLNDISLNDIVADAIKTAKSKRSKIVDTIEEDAFVEEHEEDDFEDSEELPEIEEDAFVEENEEDAFEDSEELPEINELEEEYEEED